MTLNDFADCIETELENRAAVDALEEKLARRYGVEPSELVELDDAGMLDDSPLVADWRATSARLASWTIE